MKSYQTAAGYAVPAGNTAEYFYQVKDWLGTPHITLDALGTVKNAVDYYPYGKALPGRSAYGTNYEGYRYQYTGHEKDGETGYQYHGARYYDEDLARYLSVDPLAMQFHAWSTYNYVMGNPNKFIDPTGKGPEDVEGGPGSGMKDISKRFGQLQKDSKKLSAKEHKEANRYAKKTGGSVQEYKDSYGNERYTVKKVSFEKESNNPFDMDGMEVATKTFNAKKWKDIRSGQKAVKDDILYAAEQFANRASNIKDAYSLSLGGNAILGGGGSLSVGIVYFTRGKDKGFHFALQTGQGMGLQGGGGISVGQADHYGDPRNMMNDFQGLGYQVSGKMLLGASVSLALGKENQVTWLGGTTGVGPAYGASGEITHTGLDLNPDGFK